MVLYCGDGIRQGGEQCDGTDSPNNGEPLWECDQDTCTESFCGNNQQDTWGGCFDNPAFNVGWGGCSTYAVEADFLNWGYCLGDGACDECGCACAGQVECGFFF